MRKKKLKLGDIYKIPLPDGRFAFGRLYKEYALAIYKNTYKNVSELPQNEDYVFIVSVYKDLLQDGEWEVVSNRAFATEEDAWAPRKCIKDKISGKYSLYYRGQIIPSSENECEGLEQVAVWDRHHVIDRIMGSTKWNIK